MVKKTLCSAALLAVLMLLFTGLALAQDRSQIKPTATIGEQVLVRPMRGVLKSPFRLLQQQGPLQPAYCSPCLFYGGDGDPSSPNANGLWDNNSADFGISGVIYTPFKVEKTTKCGGACKWAVTGIGGNIEMFPSPPSLLGQDWSIVTGVADGGTPSSTTVLCSGTDSAPVMTDTGRLFFGFFEEWNVAAHVSGCPALKPSKKTTYYQTNPVDTGNGVFQLAYESNVSDWPTAPNAFGPPEPGVLSFFYSPAFGFATFTNANTLGFFPAFSTDLEGNLTK